MSNQTPEENLERLTRVPRIPKKVDMDERARIWWIENALIIQHLDAGSRVAEIARMVGKNDRQIREVRERLYDLRAIEENDRP